eukprot:ANDGO_00250.mRNA.1 putative CDP-alcohol phosphatidyltransferase class-I family protein 2
MEMTERDSQQTRGVRKMEGVRPFRYVREPSRILMHDYRCLDDSLLGRYGLNRYWNYVSFWIPLRWSANWITFAGFLCMVAAFVLVVVHDPQFSSVAPDWVYVLCGLLTFAYQTLDACDGKQARRTGSASPMGELWDHGLDAVSCVLSFLIIGHALQLRNWDLLCAVLMGTVGFFASHWEEFHTGFLYFGPINAATEGVVGASILLIATGVVGAEIWNERIPLEKLLFGSSYLQAFAFADADLRYNTFFFRMCIVPGFFFTLAANVINVAKCLSGFVHPKRGNFKPTSTTRMDAFIVFFPVLMTATLALVSYRKCLVDGNGVCELEDRHPLLFYLPVLLIIAFMSNRLTVDRMTSIRFRPTDPILVIMPLLVFNQYTRTLDQLAESLLLLGSFRPGFTHQQWQVLFHFAFLVLAVCQHVHFFWVVMRAFKKVLGRHFWSGRKVLHHNAQHRKHA